jgi:signal transduction histidine kinase
MNQRTPMSRLLHLPILAVIAVGLSSIGVSIFILYSAAFTEQTNRLSELSRSQARLIEAVARFDLKYHGEVASTIDEPTLFQIIEAHANYTGLGETGEFTLARHEGDRIRFILERRHTTPDEAQFIPFRAENAEPMRRALSGQSGTMVGLDYRGEQVLAAYEPVGELNLGIVAKIDLSEIRQPFIVAGIWALLISSGFIVVAIFAFMRITLPMTENLIEMTAQATEANQAKSRFLAAMSHDLRTPLNAILGFSDMMRTNAFGPLGNAHYEEYADDIHNSGAMLISLINDVLDISKVEAGKLELKEEVLDIQELVTACIHQLSPMAETSEQIIIPRVPPDIPALKADERVLFQLLNNLLSNAIKFTPNGGRIELEVRRDRKDQLIFSISDTGIGMSKIEIETALKPFEQVDGTHSRRHKGTGLGLHLCVNFMKLFDGTLEIKSAVGQGTTVSVTFPSARTIYP